jgi:hypothetical protein
MGGEDRCTHNFGGNLSERGHLEDLCLNGRILNLEAVGWEDMEWIDLAQDKWQAPLNAIINLRVA